MHLALDTSTTWTSIALVDDHEIVALDEVEGVNPGEDLVARIDVLVRRSGISRTQVDGIVVGVGPGPYTSTRVGVAVARTLGLALGVSVVGVCSHDAVAAAFVAQSGQPDIGDFVVATDARRREIYWARYDSDARRLVGPTVGKPADVIADYRADVFVGNGLDRYPDLVQGEGVALAPEMHPCAQWIAVVAEDAMARGETVPTAQPELADHASGASVPIDLAQRLFAPYPLYLRRPDAVPSAKVVAP